MSRPTSTVTKKHLVVISVSNINRRKLLSQLEIERLQYNWNTAKKQGDPVMTPKSTELKTKIMAKLNHS